jgi:hypothetical protein
MDKSQIINEIKSHYNIKTDSELASFLGVSQPTISAWRKRNTIDYELIITKCNDINPEWLITGKGEMLKLKVPGISKITEDGKLKTNENPNLKWDNWFDLCLEKANELEEIQQAILKVLNMSKAGNEIKLSKKEVDVLNSFYEMGSQRLMNMSFEGLLKKNKNYESFDYENLLNELNINISIANKMLLNYINEVQFAVFCDTNKRPYLIYPENFYNEETD